jgi:hypothetical protein
MSFPPRQVTLLKKRGVVIVMLSLSTLDRGVISIHKLLDGIVR